MDVDVQEITLAIMDGRLDGHLATISKALGQRFISGPGSMYWRLDFPIDDGIVSVTEEDITVNEAELIEKSTGLTWAHIVPHQSATCAKAVLATVLHTRHGKSMKAAGDIAGGLSALELTRCIDHYEVTPAPLV